MRYLHVSRGGQHLWAEARDVEHLAVQIARLVPVVPPDAVWSVSETTYAEDKP